MAEKKAKRTIRLEDVPQVPPDTPFDNPNGDFIFADGDRRWRFTGAGVCKYYIRTQAGKGLGVTPYEEMYRGPRS